MPHPITAATCVAALALSGAAWGSAATASTHRAERAQPTVTTVAKKLVGPLSVAQAPDGTRWWTDDFASVLWKQAPGQAPVVALQGKKRHGIEAVSADGGLLRFTTGANDNSAGVLWTLSSTGALTEVADLHAYEKAANPDHAFRYGFRRTPRSCLAQVPKQVPASYRGVVESHPYATASAAGTTYVADAGANAIFAVSPTGAVSTVAALEPVKVRITKAGAAANKLPACTVGRTYAFEAVPTDVEVGPGGALYVTSLPGGPEDGSLGAHGRVLRIDPTTGATSTIADGLLSPTGVAVSPTGDVYVAQLFAGVVSKIAAGSSKVRTYAKVPFPAAVDWTATGLLATTNAVPMGKKPKGAVVTITP